MRKIHQKQILEILGSLREAQKAGLFADCQDGALSIGEFIESIMGEGTQTVALLEEYCEVVYKASIGEASDKALERQLIKVENSVKNELKPTKIEVAFISYKASMSDCLESIYLAAKEDPDCDAYWIPIPYYDKNTDGSFGTMHFEGAESYSDKFDCIDWKKYDIEERRPDVIFVFNPYDDWNLVTCIHPDFFCERLRDFTDMLVYVPYFVTIVNTIAKIYCDVPGCYYAHKVIMQSDAIRDSYAKNLEEYFQTSNEKPNDKLITLGNPKYDKVAGAQRGSYTLPDEWSRLINDRKIVLFNTTVTGLLQGGQMYINKIRDVLKIFRSRDDVILWWRPHPLVGQTLRSMRPSLAVKYTDIVEEYKQEAYGIFDETPDLHRSIAWCDAYYGSSSSVVTLFGDTGKPIMIINLKCLTSGEHRLAPSFLYKEKNNLWVTPEGINALLKASEEDLEFKYIGEFPDELRPIWIFLDLYEQPVEHKGTFYFPHRYRNEVIIYDKNSASFDKITLKPYDTYSNESRSFTSGCVVGDDIFFPSVQYPAIVKLNTVSKEISYYSDWIEKLGNLITDNEKMFFSGAIAVDNSIYLAACCANAVVELNLKTLKSTVYEVGNESNRFGGICYDGEYFWLSPRHSTPVVKWSPDKGVVKVFPGLVNEGEINGIMPVVYSSGYVWLLPGVINNAYKIDVKTDATSIVQELSATVQNSSEPVAMRVFRYNQIQVVDEKIIAYNYQSDCIVEYNCNTGEYREKRITISVDATDSLDTLVAKFLSSAKNKSQRQIYRETGLITLSKFADAIVSSDDKSNEVHQDVITSGDTAGKRIYKYVKQAILS